MNKNKIKILFIEDDKSGRELSLYNLKKAGYHTDFAVDGEEGIGLFEQNLYDLIITDLKMPKISGMEVLKYIRKKSDIPVIVITAFGNMGIAVEAMKNGAFDFLPKPFGKEHLLLIVKKALKNRELKQKIKALKIKSSGIEKKIIYKSSLISDLIKMTDNIAYSSASILISGESGTGKELFARRLHIKSNRADKPFVAINCSAIPEHLLESELFGYEKGAFTGAVNKYKGKFAEADKGTLFLDEIGELPLHLQSKLLRVLQEKEISPLGSSKSIKIDVRIISATNKNLKEDVAVGKFRNDLYYRLNVVELVIPPLRTRREDIELLIQYFINKTSEKGKLKLEQGLIDILKNYDWPGNVRELQNVCERMVLLTYDNILKIKDLPSEFSEKVLKEDKQSNLLDFVLPEDGFSLVDLEKDIILKVLKKKNGNLTKTADYLHIPRHILVYKITKYGIRRENFIR